jgi:hypothetical protein
MLLKNKYIHSLACMLTLLFCVLIARPFVSMGVCDDWSYIWTARVFADTGHFTYNGWATAMLGWQVYLGALFIKLFGFSFTSVRFSVLVVSLLCAALMQRTFVRSGASEGMASVATLSLVLSPLFLPLSFSFMTDVPALLVLVFCIYCCIRALQSISDKAVLSWLTFAALSNVVGGTVRQIAWLGVLLIVPCAAWCMRRRRYILLVGTTLWIIGVLSIALYMQWFRAQPYAVVEKVLFTYHTYLALYAIDTTLAAMACLLPVMIAFVITHPAGKRLTCNRATIIGALVGALFFWWSITTPRNYFSILKGIPFDTAGNYMSIKGMGADSILGKATDMAPVIVRFLITMATFSAFSGLIAFLFTARNTLLTADTHASDQHPHSYISNASLVLLLAPFTVVYSLLIFTRANVWDRYFLPLQFIFTIGLIRVYRQTISEKLPRLCLLIGLVYVVYSVAATHDLFAFYRARVDATKEIIATGIPRTAIEAGFEYDAWTQLEQVGHVNEPKVLFPPDAYHAWVGPNVPPSCIAWFRSYTPSVQPLLHLSHQPDNCFRPSQFAPVAYETWLPPRKRAIYILAGH